MTIQEKIEQFFASKPHAVVGASRDRAKYGNKVFRAYLQNDLEVYPVNPSAKDVEGVEAFPTLASLPQPRVWGLRDYESGSDRTDRGGGCRVGNREHLDAAGRRK